jgi:hypothetical protein
MRFPKHSVVPGPAAGRSPEPITLKSFGSNYDPDVWIPGSPLRGAPE